MWRVLATMCCVFTIAAAVVIQARAGEPTNPGVATTAIERLRVQLADVVTATDAARERQDIAGFDDAVHRLDARHDLLATALADLLPEAERTAVMATLDADLAGLVQAARAYAGGAADEGTGADAYDRVTRQLAVLQDAVETAAMQSERQAAAAREWALLLGLTGAVCFVCLAIAWWWVDHRNRRLLQEREDIARLVADSPIVFFRTDDAGRLAFVSPQIERLLGAPPEAMLGQTLADAIAMPTLPEALAAGGSTVYHEWTDATGETRGIAISGSVREDRSGFDRGWLRDCTGDMEAVRALQESEARLRAVLDHSEYGVAVIGSRGQIALHNRPLALLLGYEPDALERMNVGELLRPADVAGVMSLIEARLWSSDAPTLHELVMVRRDSELVEVEARVGTFRRGDAEAAVVVEFHDLASRHQASDVVRRLREVDTLTGLPNRDLFRRYLDEAVAQASAASEHAGVLFFDVDRFQLANDTIGHASGDRLLRRIGEAISGAAPPGHTVARFGGDEFIVLLPGVASPERAGEIAIRLLAAIREPRRHEGREIRLTASAGLSISLEHGRTTDDLIRHAVAAMYAAKRSGGDRYAIYDPASEGASRERLTLESRLRRAFEQDEFVLHYQPLVDLQSGRICAVEALARWSDPEHGLVQPDEFIPLLEETGEITRLGEIVLMQACGTLKRWRDNGLPPVRMCVNLSARQLLDEHLVDLIRDVLARSGLQPEDIELEVTETTATLNEQRAIEVLHALHDLGVRIAIDDFGTGHSSLQRLNAFPVQVLKVDRSFVQGLADSEGGALPILKGVVAVGHALGLEVVAEGVETEVQAHVLRGIGCDLGQGFIFSHPVPEAAMRELLSAGTIQAKWRAA